ncbi:DUF2064 domain-containing protein [Spirosoma areae]
MQLPKTNTAVLLFALPDSIEASRKRVSRKSVALWRAMRALTKAKVQASGLPLLVSHGLINHQGTFGQQLSTALSVAFAQGYERIICIGNDCPDLSVTDLRRAARALSDNKSPIGADKRGGVYIIGFNRAQFDGQALAQLPWQTEHVADALRSYFGSQSITLTDLPVRADINQRVDATAVRWVGQIASRLLMTIRQALLSVIPPPVFWLPAEPALLFQKRIADRAPPAA